MTAVATRLRRLEERARSASSPTVLLYWPDQLTPCPEHPACDIEVETGVHHAGVLHLSFEEPQS